VVECTYVLKVYIIRSTVLVLQCEAFLRQGLFLRPSCHVDEFKAEFLLFIINSLLEEEKILMYFETVHLLPVVLVVVVVSTKTTAPER